jgi:hypothetical protein
VETIQTLALVLGTAFAAGLNVYATVATLGLLHTYGIVTLPPALLPVAHPTVIVLATVLFFVEFVADKLPIVDTVWDVAHTLVRPPAAALLAFAAVTSVPEPWPLLAALLAGGVALTAHGAKASTRAAANASPEPFTNWGLSLGEDAAAVGLTWLALAHPLVAVGVVALLLVGAVALLMLLFRFLRGAIRALGRRGARRTAAT